MPKLNLNATTQSQKVIKEYLEQNASDMLAYKINNGVQVDKDGKTLVNKKTLDGFMNYANDEAQKIAEKGARYACVEDAIVFGWAIHYFEEDSIEEKLYNEDGTEYAPSKKTTPKKSTPKKTTTTKKPDVKKPDVKKPEPKPTIKPIAEKPTTLKKITRALDQISIFDL